MLLNLPLLHWLPLHGLDLLSLLYHQSGSAKIAQRSEVWLVLTIVHVLDSTTTIILPLSQLYLWRRGRLIIDGHVLRAAPSINRIRTRYATTVFSLLDNSLGMSGSSRTWRVDRWLLCHRYKGNMLFHSRLGIPIPGPASLLDSAAVARSWNFACCIIA